MNRGYFAVIFLFMANLLGTFYILSKVSTALFLLEFFIISFFMLLFVITLYMFYFNVNNKHLINGIFFIFGLINTIFLYFNMKSGMLVLLTAANAFGLVISINNIKERKKAKHHEKEPKLVVEELKPEIRKRDEEKILSEVKKELEEYKRKREVDEFQKEADVLARAEKTIKEIKKTYSPGKFVASSTSSKYHTPKCDWAKKIKEKNQIWFKTDAEARRKGYRKHNCLKM